MKTNWLIENITKEESFRDLAEAVEKQGYPLQNLNGSFAYSMISQYVNQPVIFNGSIEMCKLARDFLSVQKNFPIIYCTWENYLCSKYYPALSDFLFNDNYVMVPLKEVKKRLYFFYGIFGREAMIFIRPNDGDKSFKGALLDLKDFEKWYEPSVENQLALVSTPKNIRGEWRFVCTKHKEILGYSLYRYQGLITRLPVAPPGAIELCHNILSVGYFPDSVFCVDIVEDNDGNYHLMELNSFSSAGLYACDKTHIVERVSEIALDDFKKFANIKP